MEYHPTLDPASSFEIHLLGQDVFSTTLGSLAPSTEYDLRVRVENAIGRSDPSVIMQTKTKDNGELKSYIVLKELLWMSLALLNCILQLMRYNKHTCLNK